MAGRHNLRTYVLGEVIVMAHLGKRRAVAALKNRCQVYTLHYWEGTMET